MTFIEKIVLTLITVIFCINIVLGNICIKVNAEDSAEWNQEDYNYIQNIARRVDFNKRWYRIMDENRKHKRRRQ